MPKYCKHCGAKVYGTSHYCPEREESFNSGIDDFLISAAVGAATDSALLGGLLGGSFLGGITGDSLDGDLWD